MKTTKLILLFGATIALTAFAAASFYKNTSNKENKVKEEAVHSSSIPNSVTNKAHIQEVSSPKIPNRIVFADQEISQNQIDFRERLDKEIIVNMYRHSSTLLFLKKSKKFFSIIEPILKKHGIPEDFKYLAVIESGLSNVVSPAKAAGIWQFMKATGKSYDLEINKFVDERYHLEKATKAACKYLQNMYSIYKDWILSAAAYNRGQGGISNALEEQNVNSYFDLFLNNETSRYVFRMLAVKLIMENPEKYGFYLNNEDYYTFPNYRTIEINEDIEDLKSFAKENNTDYKTIKLLNPWLRSSKLKVGDKSYLIKLPKID